MTHTEMVEHDIAKEKFLREIFQNGEEPNEETKAMWALADVHNKMRLARARQLDVKEAVSKIKISSEVKIKK